MARKELTPYQERFLNYCFHNQQYDVEQYVQWHGDIHVVNEYGENAVISAVRGGNEELAMWLIEKGVDITLRRKEDKATVLYLAALEGLPKVVEHCIKRGLKIEARESEFNDTPLIAAARRNHLECAQLLLRAGASYTRKNKQGLNALEMARQNTCYKVLQVIEQKELDNMAGQQNNNHNLNTI